MRGLRRLAVLVLLAAALAGCGDPPAHPARPTLDEAARASLREAFRSAEPERVDAALATLAAAEAPLDWLLEGLQQPDRGVREWSAHALGDLAARGDFAAGAALAERTDGVVRALVLSFEDKDDYVRWKAARALGNVGPNAAMALPLLRVCAEAESEQAVTRAAAIKAIAQIEGRAD